MRVFMRVCLRSSDILESLIYIFIKLSHRDGLDQYFLHVRELYWISLQIIMNYLRRSFPRQFCLLLINLDAKTITCRVDILHVTKNGHNYTRKNSSHVLTWLVKSQRSQQVMKTSELIYVQGTTQFVNQQFHGTSSYRILVNYRVGT